MWAKAMEGVKRLEMQPRRTRRRKGRGMVGESSWEQERPVSAPAVRPLGKPTEGWTGSDEPYKRRTRRSGGERSGSRRRS